MAGARSRWVNEPEETVVDGLRDTLRRTGGINAVTAELKLSASEGSALVDALLPALIGAFHLHCRNSGGGDTGCKATLALLEQTGGGSLAARIMAPGPTDPADGRKLLAGLLGGGDAVPAVVAALAQRNDLDAGRVEAMMPRLAMLVGGYVAARAADQPSGELSDLIGPAESEDELAAIVAAARSNE